MGEGIRRSSYELPENIESLQADHDVSAVRGVIYVRYRSASKTDYLNSDRISKGIVYSSQYPLVAPGGAAH